MLSPLAVLLSVNSIFPASVVTDENEGFICTCLTMVEALIEPHMLLSLIISQVYSIPLIFNAFSTLISLEVDEMGILSERVHL